MESEPVKEILGILTKLYNQRAELLKAIDLRERAIRNEYYEQLKTDKEKIEYEEQSKELADFILSSTKDLFLPGVILYLPEQKPAAYVIVDEIYDAGYANCIRLDEHKPSRRSYTSVMLFNRAEDVQIVPLEHIQDPKLRAKVAKIVAKIRLKDW